MAKDGWDFFAHVHGVAVLPSGLLLISNLNGKWQMDSQMIHCWSKPTDEPTLSGPRSHVTAKINMMGHLCSLCHSYQISVTHSCIPSSFPGTVHVDVRCRIISSV